MNSHCFHITGLAEELQAQEIEMPITVATLQLCDLEQALGLVELL